MRTVWKYTIPVDDQWHPISDGKVVHVDWLHHEEVNVWVEVAVTAQYGDLQAIDPPRPVRVFGTGQPLPPRVSHLGTAVMPGGGRLVWHVYGGERA